MTTSSSPSQLFGDAARGDDEALMSLVRQHHDRVYRYGLRVCRDGFDAEDAVQEAFLKLSTRRDVVADQGALSWLMSVVRNACRRFWRPFQRQRQRRALGAPLAGAEVDEVAGSAELSPEAALQRWELVRAVHAAISELERPYREVLVWRDLEGRSGAEVCAALGLELAAMKSRLLRARQMLRARLEPGIAAR